MARKHPRLGPDLSHIAEALRPLAVSIDTLLTDPANARIHPERNLDGIMGSLAAYGQQKPVVVRKETMTVVAGNGTLEAARRLGWTHLAASVVPMDAATAAGFSIADNRTGELAEWDEGALAILLAGVEGGQDERLDAMLAELQAEIGEPQAAPTDPEPEAAPDESEQLKERFCVLVTCESEAAQVELLERLSGEGYECRSLIS